MVFRGLSSLWIQWDFQVWNSLCEGPPSELEYVVFLSSIGKRAELGQMWQNSCLHIFEEVCFMGRWIFHDFDRQGLASPPFTFQIPLVTDCGKSLIQKTCPEFNPHFCSAFRWDYLIKAAIFMLILGNGKLEPVVALPGMTRMVREDVAPHLESCVWLGCELLH